MDDPNGQLNILSWSWLTFIQNPNIEDGVFWVMMIGLNVLLDYHCKGKVHADALILFR